MSLPTNLSKRHFDRLVDTTSRGRTYLQVLLRQVIKFVNEFVSSDVGTIKPSLALGSTPPTALVFDVAAGLEFDAEAEKVCLIWQVPQMWDGESDMSLNLRWFGDGAIPDTKAVIWDISYRVKSVDDDVDAGTVATATATYTQAGAGVDATLHETSITIDYDETNQPLVKGSYVIMLLNRDITAEAGNSFADGAVLADYDITYTVDLEQ